jgi:hypothetical protein
MLGYVPPIRPARTGRCRRRSTDRRRWKRRPSGLRKALRIRWGFSPGVPRGGRSDTATLALIASLGRDTIRLFETECRVGQKAAKKDEAQNSGRPPRNDGARSPLHRQEPRTARSTGPVNFLIFGFGSYLRRGMACHARRACLATCASSASHKWARAVILSGVSRGLLLARCLRARNAVEGPLFDVARGAIRTQR